MKKLHYIIIFFISVFINLNVLADATFVDSFDVANEEDEPRGLTFNNDGTRMYVTGWRGDDVNEYRLTTPFDVSTATFVQTNGFMINSDPRDVKFNPDGTRMFVLGRGTADRVFQITLTTPFDISTAVAGNNNIDEFNTNDQETSSNEEGNSVIHQVITLNCCFFTQPSFMLLFLTWSLRTVLYQ